MGTHQSQIATLSTSPDAGERLKALQLMRQRIECGDPPADYLALALPLIEDPGNDCRWQALVVVGESLPTNPAAVWDVICRYGDSSDEDMRAGVATVLLEHLLEHHFDAYFPRLKERIEAGAVLLADTLSSCWRFDLSEEQWSKVRELGTRRP